MARCDLARFVLFFFTPVCLSGSLDKRLAETRLN